MHCLPAGLLTGLCEEVVTSLEQIRVCPASALIVWLIDDLKHDLDAAWDTSLVWIIAPTFSLPYTASRGKAEKLNCSDTPGVEV